MHLQAGVASDRGLIRPANEDSFLLRRGLYAVCDGMGGARGGEVASQMACLGLLALNPASAGQHDLRAAIVNANQAIVQRGAGEAHLLGMGTTLTAMLVREGHLTLAHVGDSRAYILHSEELTQLTEDHSWVAEMVRRGELTPQQAAIHPHRSVITRALGTDGEIDPDLLEIPLVPGDRIMLCSDGLTGMVSDSDIADLLAREGEAQEVAELLVKAALAGGGEDNVTVIVVDVLADADGSESGAAAQSLGPFGGDQILFGPSDRGSLVAAGSHRGRRSGGSVRERLGLSLPSVRPVASRTGVEAPETGSPDAGGHAPAAADALSSEGTAQAEAGSTPPGGPAAEAEPMTLGEPTASAPEAAPERAAAPDPAAADREGSATTPRKRRRRLWLFLVLAVVLVLALAVAGFAIYNSTVYYVGTYKDGTVALYRGLPGDVLGIELSQAVELSSVNYDTLAQYQKQRVDTHDLISKEDGQVFLRSLVQPQ